MERGKIRRLQLGFERDYTQIPNRWLRDERLTYRARGILGLLLSHKDGFAVALTDLVVNKAERQEAVRTAVRELEAHGYLLRVYPVNGGRFAAPDWILQEPPEGDERPRSIPVD